MKVNDQNLVGASTVSSARSQETQRADRVDPSRSGSVNNGSGSGDSVELSGALGALSAAMETFSSASSGKVQALAGEYQSGSYQPDSLATSQGMVSDALRAGMR